MCFGRIHSIESMGLVDGPGIRTVVFLQGCHLRCLYCHNPDTWSKDGGILFTPEELLKKLLRFRPYYGKEGGVTFSGGEPLLQKDFLKRMLRLCKESGIHTCLDTAGHGVGDYEEILTYTDLVLFDVKHITKKGYQTITGQSPEESLLFLKTAQKMAIPLWIRHVVVPGLTDTEEHFLALKNYLSTLKYVQKIELLPYHVLGVPKYRTLKIPYPLEGTPPANPEQVRNQQEKLKKELL